MKHEIIQRVQDALGTRPAYPSQIADKTGLALTTVRTALKQLVDEGKARVIDTNRYSKANRVIQALCRVPWRLLPEYLQEAEA